VIRRSNARTSQPVGQSSQSPRATGIACDASEGARDYAVRGESERRPSLYQRREEVAGVSNQIAPRRSASGFSSAHRPRAPCLPGLKRSAEFPCSWPRRPLEGIPSSSGKDRGPKAERAPTAARVNLIDRVSQRRRPASGSSGTRCPRLAGSPRTRFGCGRVMIARKASGARCA
jgi:hypothetical protein